MTDRSDGAMPGGSVPGGRSPTGESTDTRLRQLVPPAESAQIAAWIRQTVWFAIGTLALYLFAPRLLEIVEQAPRLRTIRPGWFVVMVVLEVLSFACVWWLIRIALPRVNWFVAATSQLVSNAVSRVIPGGAAVGGATLFRMLSVSGVQQSEAGGALAATSVLSTAALVAIPATGFVMAVLGAPIPEALWPAAAAGGVLLILLVAIGSVGVGFDRPLLLVGRVIDAVLRWVSSKWGRPHSLDGASLLAERDRMVEVLGPNWPKAITAAALNWVFDYLALVAALYAVGADPRLSLVLLAYAGAAVLSMIPVTPGGLGFVEVGLIWLLVVSGIPRQNAEIATIAYRAVSLLLPILCGVPAWLAHRRRFGQDQLAPTG